MSYEVIISSAALLDIEETIKWYENQNLHLGEELKNSFYGSLHKLESNPFLFSKKHKEVRVIYIRRFPYGVHYTIEENRVKVFGFFHMKRNPLKWLDRLK